MWQTKYASDVPKNLGLGFDFFLTKRSQSVLNLKENHHKRTFLADPMTSAHFSNLKNIK